MIASHNTHLQVYCMLIVCAYAGKKGILRELSADICVREETILQALYVILVRFGSFGIAQKLE